MSHIRVDDVRGFGVKSAAELGPLDGEPGLSPSGLTLDQRAW